MKELSIEEKAKRYDELLVKLQEAKVDDNVCDERYCCVIGDIVPELKEDTDLEKAALAAFPKMSRISEPKETLLGDANEDKRFGFKVGAKWARHLCHEQYEKLLGFIDLLNHGALTQEQHEILNRIIDFSGEPQEVFRRIAKIHNFKIKLES